MALKRNLPDLGVIIVSWNVKDLLDTCLLSLREEIDGAGIQSEVWVVDSASSDGTPQMMREQHRWVKFDACTENIGYVRGNNRVMTYLLSVTKPKYIWLLNPDTVVPPGTLTTMLNFFEQHPQAGLIGPQLLNADQSLQPGAFRFPGLLQPLFDLGKLPQRFYYTRWNGRYPTEAYKSGKPFRIDHPLGAAMMARTETVQQVELLDEEFFMYCEEIDWAWRMQKQRWEVWMVPEAKIIHHSGASTKQARPETTAYLWESRARLYRKHHKSLTHKLVSFVVRRTFSRMKAESSEWEQAYKRIIKAWKIKH